jgi:hypothetical protein
MSYARQKQWVLGFLVFYFIAGMYAVDRYPFFDWALFTKIPNEQRDYSIQLRAYDGTVYEPALPFSESKFLFDAIGQSPTQYTQPISDLGTAIMRADERAVEQHREFVERMFDGKPFVYDVLKITYDPVELWRTGAYRSREVVASFENTYAP